MPYSSRTKGTSLPYDFKIPDATEHSAGVMSAADKIKLDSLPSGGGIVSLTVLPPLLNIGTATNPIIVLVGTTTPPNPNEYYGTDGAGTLGYHPLPSATPVIYACPAGAVVGQPVYETAANLTVALANATDLTKSPAIGVIATKPTATTCTIAQVGPMTLAGLPADQSELFLDTTDGGITATAPMGSGNVVQPLGLVTGATSVEWHVDPESYTIRA